MFRLIQRLESSGPRLLQNVVSMNPVGTGSTRADVRETGDSGPPVQEASRTGGRASGRHEGARLAHKRRAWWSTSSSRDRSTSREDAALTAAPFRSRLTLNVGVTSPRQACRAGAATRRSGSNSRTFGSPPPLWFLVETCVYPHGSIRGAAARHKSRTVLDWTPRWAYTSDLGEAMSW